MFQETTTVDCASRHPVRSRNGWDTTGGAFTMNDQGFGTNPLTSPVPFRSCPVIVALYLSPGVNSVPLLKRDVKIVWVASHHVKVCAGRGSGGLNVTLRAEPQSIGLLNVMTRSAVGRTFRSPSGGSVERMNGALHAVMNRHGFGTGPGTKLVSFKSLPPVGPVPTVTV